MNRKAFLITIFSLIFILILSGCTSNNTSVNDLQERIKEKDSKIGELEGKIKDLEIQLNNPTGTTMNSLLSKVIQVIDTIKNKDMNKLSSFVHPTKGLRFTPYDYIDIQNDKVFATNQVAGLAQDTQSYTWGNYDGTGDPIDLNFNAYYDRFIYDQDFANPHIIGNNVAIGKGNTINNIEEAYPNGHFIEFHFTGLDPQYSGIDWRSLKLVFEEYNGNWYLVGIVHGEWTI